MFALLTLTFLLLSLGNFTMSDHWTKAGGYVGLLTALAAWYASFAGVTNFTFQRTVLPHGSALSHLAGPSSCW